MIPKYIQQSSMFIIKVTKHNNITVLYNVSGLAKSIDLHMYHLNLCGRWKLGWCQHCLHVTRTSSTSVSSYNDCVPMTVASRDFLHTKLDVKHQSKKHVFGIELPQSSLFVTLIIHISYNTCSNVLCRYTQISLLSSRIKGNTPSPNISHKNHS